MSTVLFGFGDDIVAIGEEATEDQQSGGIPPWQGEES